jgi:hypothetical protein
MNPEPPSFLENNPWTDILSQRGKEQGQLFLPVPTPSESSKNPQEKTQKQSKSTQKHEDTPLPFNIGPIDTRDKLTRANKRLLDALLRNKVTVPKANAASLILRNQISLVCPPKPVEVHQTTTVTSTDLSQLKEDEQAVLARAIAKLEAGVSPNQSS